VSGRQRCAFRGFIVESFLRLENRHTGEVLRVCRVPYGEGQMALILDGSLPPGVNGPPVHVHFCEREEVGVKTGLLGARVGNAKLFVQPGATAVFPAGVVHKWWNAGDERLEMNGLVFPAVDLDRYLQAIFAVQNAGASGKPSIFYLARVLWRHRRTQAVMSPPRIVQWIFFPLVLMTGFILGKYRGKDWPGSPESCTGAPEVTAANAA
jgi:mannose-6-phosphate isomerase-like protein (cupin superfamily)